MQRGKALPHRISMKSIGSYPHGCGINVPSVPLNAANSGFTIMRTTVENLVAQSGASYNLTVCGHCQLSV
jgi:murein endopeptidase